MHFLHSSISQLDIVQSQHRRIFRPTATQGRGTETTNGDQEMAHANHIQTASPLAGLGAWLRAGIETIRENNAKRRTFKRTYDELSSLSNNDLADLGISRSMVRGIAFEAAYEPTK